MAGDRVRIRNLWGKQKILVGVIAVVGLFAVGVAVRAVVVSMVAVEPENSTLAGCATSVNDASASGGKAVRFGGCQTTDIDSPLNLDDSGATIPDTNYTIPSGAIFMSTTGNDSNAGTQAAPVKTLNVAISKVPSGGTIVVRGGTDENPAVYRDWYFYHNTTLNIDTFYVASKPFTLQAYPHEKAWFDGTDVIPTNSWTSDGNGHWYMNWETPSFCGTLPTATQSNYYSRSLVSQNIGASGNTNDGPCAWRDTSSDPTNPMAGDPQMVFIDGEYKHQVATLAEATGGNFYYDWANRRMYISTNPSGRTVELAARPMAMQLSGSGSKVLGLGFRRYATHVYANNPGVIYASKNQVYENNVFTQNAGLVLMLSKPTDTVVNHNVFAFNGSSGIGGNGSRSIGGTDNLVVKNNVINNNNTELFWTNCSYSCAAANMKINNMIGFTVQNNIIKNGQGRAYGTWCDITCNNGKYIGNLIYNNGESGILYEISDNGIIASNLIYKNGGAGIQSGSANTKIYNNTLAYNNLKNSYKGNLWIYDDPRSPENPDTGNTGASAVGPDTAGMEYANNIVIGNGRMQSFQGAYGSTNTNPDQFWTTLGYNAYWRPQGSSQALVHWVVATAGNPVVTDYTSNSAFQSAHTGLGGNSVDIVGGTDPFFVNSAGDNYLLKSGNQAGVGMPLPSDVAAALNVASGSVLPKGAINWPHF